MKKLDNPFTTNPEPDVKFWTARSKLMKEFKSFFEVECVRRGAWPSNAVVGDVGSGKTRLFEYLTRKFKLDPTKVVCYVSLNEVFKELTAKHEKEIDVRFLETFYNEIYKQLETIYQSVLESKEATVKQKEFAKNVIETLTEAKRKVIEPRLEDLGTLDGMIQKKEDEIKKATTKDEKQRLSKEKRALERAVSGKLREEVFTPEEFYLFLKILLKRLRSKLDIDTFVIYVDELERIIEMERDYDVFLKSTTESELRDRLIQNFSGQGLKIAVACTSKIWMNFEARFRESFLPKPIPNLEGDDLEGAIKDHLRRMNQEKFNPFKEKDAIKFIAYYSYHNFRNCMYVLNFCYEEFIKKYETGYPEWICDLNYVIKNHFDKSVRIEFYNHCIQILERQLPRLRRPQIERWMKSILVQFDEFSYDTLWKTFKYHTEKHDFNVFISTLRNIGAISEVKENTYVVNRDNFAIIELERTPLEVKALDVFLTVAGRENRVDRAKFFRKLEEEGFDDRTRESVLRSLGDTLQIAGDEVVYIGTPPGTKDSIRRLIQSVGREHYKTKVKMEIETLAPYILSQVWEWKVGEYGEEDNIWLVSTSFDPTTGGAIERTIPGVVLFRDYRYEKPSSEEMLKIDILNLKRVLEKNSKLQFALILCECDPPLPDFLGLPATKAEIERAKREPILWKRVFGVHPSVLGTEDIIARQGFDTIWKEDKMRFSDLIFVYPIHSDERFPEGSKLENEKVIDYILAIDKILSVIGKDIKDKYLKPLLITIKGVLVNPTYDILLKRVLNRIWEIDLPIGMLKDRSLWPQRLEKKKWIDNDVVLKLLDQIAISGTLKADEETRRILAGLTTTGFFGYHGKKVEEIYLKRDATFGGKFIPQQFKAIFDTLSDQPRDASHILMTYVEQHEPFTTEVPGERLLTFDPKRLRTNRRTRSLIESVDLALYTMFKMFPELIVQARREDGRLTYRPLKEVIDPQKFLEDTKKLDRAITFLTNGGFELKKEAEEIKDLVEMGKAIKQKLDKSLDADAKQIMLKENENKLTGEKAPAQARCDYLYGKINEKFTNIKNAFLAYPIIKEWQKVPYFEKWNERTQSTEKETLLPLPDEIKKDLETNISAWIKAEEYTREKAKKIKDIWETKIWSKLYDKIADDAEPIIKLVETVNKGMRDVPHVSSISKRFEREIPLTFDDYAKLLERIKNFKQIEATLRIIDGYIRTYNEKMIAYNSKVVSLSYDLMKMSRSKLGNLSYIVSELIKIDACKEKANEYQKIIRKGRRQFGDKYNYLIVQFESGMIDEEAIRGKLNTVLNDLTLNGLYGCFVLYALESFAQEEMTSALFRSLKGTKFVEFKKGLRSIKSFCERRKVRFKKDFWKNKEEYCLQKYGSFVKGYLEGIWRQQTTITIDGEDVQNITQFEQLIDSFNEGIRRDIVEDIPQKMGEPYSTILSEIKNAYQNFKVQGKKEIFATILKLLDSPKVRRHEITPKEMLKFLNEIEKFGLLW